MIPWHRLFGITLTDFFTDTAYEVELEKDLSLDELTGHYVNYRKWIGADPDNLPPAEAFRLYAVGARYPGKLSEAAAFRPVKEGVYDVLWGTRAIRIIVLSRIPEEPRNALWHLFSAKPDSVAFGVSEYRWRTSVSSAINELFRKYKMEGVIAMPYTIEDFQRDYVREHIDKLSPVRCLKSSRRMSV